MNNHRIGISCAAILGAACIILGVLTISGGGMIFRQRSQAAVPTAVRRTITARPTELQNPGEPTPLGATPMATDVISNTILSQMDLIEEQVLEIRGLPPNRDVPRYLISRAELRQRLEKDLAKEYSAEEQRAEEILFTSLGLLPAGQDLRALYLDLLAEGISGFYDIDDKVMYVVEGTEFSGLERITYAHEYTHALQDMAFDLQEGLQYSDDFCQDDFQRCAGVQALVEGDATLTQSLWLTRHATPQDQADIQNLANLESPVYDAAPPFLQQDLLFPYQAGLEFVQTLYTQGGWNAVDDTYTHPPASTEQILHPDRYPDDPPQPVEIPDLIATLGEGWQVLEQDSLGEWYTYLVLAYSASEDTSISNAKAMEASAGWEGDQFAVYAHLHDPGASVLVWVSVWEVQADAVEFLEAMRTQAIARWGNPAQEEGDSSGWEAAGTAITLFRNNTSTFWIMGPDTATNQRILNEMQSQ